MGYLTKPDIDKFHRDGYIIVKNLFSKQEVEQFREQTLALLEESKKKGLSYKIKIAPALEFIKGDILSKDVFRHIILNKRVIDTIKELLGTNNLYYFGNSAFHIHSDGFRGYHRDCVDRTKYGPDWEREYKLVRCGLYLQDHYNHSGGLEVLPGSHDTLDPAKYRPAEFVRAKTGDFVIWNMRIEHSGNTMIPRFCKRPFRIGSRMERVFRRLGLMKNEEKDRIAMFIAYGADLEQVQRFVDSTNANKPDFIEGWKASPINDSIVSEAAAKGLEIIPPVDGYIKNN